jgi:serine phosphatase RsbU (regulator of sigma subunit)/predicted enzyme related to lactoylglutathione lyase
MSPDGKTERPDAPLRQPHLRIHAVNIYVRDQERAVRFYLDQLGFELAFDMRVQSGDRWVAVSPPDGTAILSLIAPKPNTPEYKLIGRSTHVTLMTEDVAKTFQEWSKRGVRFHMAPRLKRLKYVRDEGKILGTAARILLGKEEPVWGSAFARFRDVDGNAFALVSFDEVTHQLEAERRAAVEKAESERRAAQELEIAKQVQSRLFPQVQPNAPGLDYAGLCIQARQVGGDYYDFLELGEGRLGLTVGDIAGKGIAAALLMANLQASLRSHCAIAVDDPGKMLRAVNHLFCQSTTDGAFATLFFAEYDTKCGRLRYANCGHLPALLLKPDGVCERLEATATVLGVFNSWDCSIGERQLAPGDVLALYTDGITESWNHRLEEFGEQRLVDSLRTSGKLGPSAALNSILAAVRRHSPGDQHDDMTLILAKRN